MPLSDGPMMLDAKRLTKAQLVDLVNGLADQLQAARQLAEGRLVETLDLQGQLAALRDPGIRIPLGMAKRFLAILKDPPTFMWDEELEEAWEDSKELARLIREEEERCDR